MAATSTIREIGYRSRVTASSEDPGPIRVDVLDLDDHVELLPRDDRYAAAWVVGTRRGVPQAIVEVDLTASEADVRRQIDSLREAPTAPRTPGVENVRDDQLPMISVVIPTIVARVDELRSCLDSLAAVDYPQAEIVLVDNRRTIPDPDPLPALVANHDRVRTVRQPYPGISAARNAGWTAARGEIVAFTDDDVRVDPGWLRALGARFVAEPGLDAVTGLILPAELDTPAQIWFERYYGGFSGERTFQPLTLATGSGPVNRGRVTARDIHGQPVRSFAIYGVGAYGAGANMAYRRAVLERHKEFDLALGTGTPARGGEDLAALIDVLWAGGRVGYEPAAVAHHTHRRNRPELIRQMRGNGIGYTAMLVSVIRRDPRHGISLAAQLPLAAQRLAVTNFTRLRGRRVTSRPDEPAPSARLYPVQLAVEEIRGLASGPVAYVRSLRAAARAAAISGPDLP